MNGILYINISLNEQAKAIGKSVATVKRKLQELEDEELLLKCNFGVGQVNKLYVRIPETEMDE